MSVQESSIQFARQQLDAYVRELIAWHFAPETGSLFWLHWAEKHFDPRPEVKSYADLVEKFPCFQEEWLRDLQPDIWVPARYRGRPYLVSETEGTTGIPKQRIGWHDYRIDYEEFGRKISDEHFPRGLAWLMVGPTGPRRLRLAVEHLANSRRSPCYFVDFDQRWLTRLTKSHQADLARSYKDHVVEQAMVLLKHRKIAGLFTTPELLVAIAEKVNLYHFGIRGVICVGAALAPETVRFIDERILEDRIGLYPAYGSTLMGLAAGIPLAPEDNFSITYYAPQPRAVLRVVNADNIDELVSYGEWGRVELTTMTKEFFMPRLLERDEAIRRPAREPYAWDGVAEVRPAGSRHESTVAGVE